jgi:hypothetical protein
MRGGTVRKLVVLITLGALVAFLVKKLRGDPAPQFSNHPTVTGGPLPDLVPAPADPTVPDGHTDHVLVPAPADPTTPAPTPEPPTAHEPAAAAAPDPEPLPGLVPAPEDPTVADAHAEHELVPEVAAGIVADGDPTPAATAGAGQTWVEPVDGACPDGFPIKAKVKSGIYHQPGGLAYDRTNPDRCYPSTDAAEADGLRAAKR